MRIYGFAVSEERKLLKTARKNPGDIEARINLAIFYFDKGEFALSAGLYESVLRDKYDGERKEDVERQYCILIRKYGKEGREYIREKFSKDEPA